MEGLEDDDLRKGKGKGKGLGSETETDGSALPRAE